MTLPAARVVHRLFGQLLPFEAVQLVLELQPVEVGEEPLVDIVAAVNVQVRPIYHSDMVAAWLDVLADHLELHPPIVHLLLVGVDLDARLGALALLADGVFRLFHHIKYCRTVAGSRPARLLVMLNWISAWRK